MGTVNLTRVVTGTNISSATENANQALLEGQINGGIDDANLESSKIITGSVHFKQDGATDQQVYGYDAAGANWEPITPRYGVLAVTRYAPAADTTVSTTSTSFVDVDAANMITPSFIVPASGKVLIETRLFITTTVVPIFNIRDGAADVATTADVVKASTTPDARGSYSTLHLVTSLGAGTTKQFKLGWRSPSGGTVTLGFGDASADNDEGPGWLIVHSVM